MRIPLLFCFALGILSLAGPAAAQVDSSTAKKTYRSLVVETVYPFAVTNISPAKVLPLSSMQDAVSTGTPEDLFRRHFGAIRKGDYESFIATWDSSSTAMMAEKDRKAGRGQTYWLERWRTTRLGGEVSLLNLVEYGRYSIYQYRIEVNGKPFTDSVALVRTADGWRFTQDLANSPILTYWDAPGGRIQVAPPTLVDNGNASK
jgi:hypothetical protein